MIKHHTETLAINGINTQLTTLTQDQQYQNKVTSNDPMLNWMETSTGGLLIVVVLSKAIINSGPQINKINRINSPPPVNSLARKPSGSPNVRWSLYKQQIKLTVTLTFFLPFAIFAGFWWYIAVTTPLALSANGIVPVKYVWTSSPWLPSAQGLVE